MRIVTWAIRLVVFVLLVAFAAKNAEPVTLRFYFDLALQAPLIVAAVRASSPPARCSACSRCSARVLRQRREISRAAPAQSRAAAEPPGRPPAARSEPMEFEYWWLLGFPLFFGLGWIAARIDIQQLRVASRARCRAPTSRASISC